jgi:hypothetical protein
MPPVELDTPMEWSAEADKQQLKCKLKEAFSDSTKCAEHKAGKRISGCTTHLLSTQEFLVDLRTTCRYCYALGAPNRPTREPSACWLMNGNNFLDFKNDISYRFSRNYRPLTMIMNAARKGDFLFLFKASAIVPP